MAPGRCRVVSEVSAQNLDPSLCNEARYLVMRNDFSLKLYRRFSGIGLNKASLPDRQRGGNVSAQSHGARVFVACN